MSYNLKKFISIWNSYNIYLPINEFEFDKYLKIINKLRNNNENFDKIEEKMDFIELVEIMADTIYTICDCADKYEIDYYQRTKTYDETELNYCSSILDYLENKIFND